MQVLFVTDEASEGERLRILLDSGLELECATLGELEGVTDRAGRYEIAVAGYLPPAWLAAAARLRHFLIPFAGVPMRTRRALSGFPGIAVYNSHYNAAFTAEHAWALLLAAAKLLLPADRRLRVGDWSFRYEGSPSSLLRGATLLLIGYGEIGKHLGRFGKAFGMRVWAVKRTPGEAPEIDGLFLPADLPDLLPEAKAVILSLPETARTTGLLDRDAFARMRRGVLLVNVGRGTAIGEEAFHDALRSGRIGAAGIDTWWVYPPAPEDARATFPSHHALAECENLVMSPHRASHVDKHDEEQLQSVADLLRDIAEGRLPRPVDREEWY